MYSTRDMCKCDWQIECTCTAELVSSTMLWSETFDSTQLLYQFDILNFQDRYLQGSDYYYDFFQWCTDQQY